jgi:membrane protease YdiL (CAAX protease family)
MPAFLIAVLACLPWFRPTRPLWLIACLGYILLDGTVTFAGYHLIPGLQWNWAGKGFSAILALTMILIMRPAHDELPLGLPADPASWRWTILGIIAAALFAGTVSFLFRDHAAPTAETLAYQATMPGLSEELCWRGLVFVLLARAYARANETPNLIPAAFITALLFGVIHAFNVDNGAFRLAWLPFFYAVIFGAGLAFLRLKARSIPGLILTHNAANVFSSLINYLPYCDAPVFGPARWPSPPIQAAAPR